MHTKKSGLNSDFFFVQWLNKRISMQTFALKIDSFFVKHKTQGRILLYICAD